MAKQTKITKSAHGQECQIRIYGFCNRNTETTVYAHLGGAGMALKAHDAHGAYACSSCHGVVDGHIKTEYDKDLIKLWHYEGVIRTQEILLNNELLKVA